MADSDSIAASLTAGELAVLLKTRRGEVVAAAPGGGTGCRSGGSRDGGRQGSLGHLDEGAGARRKESGGQAERRVRRHTALRGTLGPTEFMRRAEDSSRSVVSYSGRAVVGVVVAEAPGRHEDQHGVYAYSVPSQGGAQ